MTAQERNTAMKRELEYRDRLFQLMRERPDLPVVPMVFSEIVADDYCSYWMGSWGYCEITKIILGEERWHTYDPDYMESIVPDVIGWDDFENMPDGKEREFYDSLPWQEVIVVYIDLPIE